MRIAICTLNAKYIHSSLALRYLKAYLSPRGFNEIILREYSINDLEDHILNDLYLLGADVLAFSCYIWNISPTLRIASCLKLLHPDMLLVLGGPETSFDSERILHQHPYVDAIIQGEGEESLLQLLTAIEQGRAWTGITGLVHRQGDLIMSSAPGPALKFESVPFPYTESEMGELKQHIVYYESSRGCPYSCSYCLSSVDRSLRFLSLDRVLGDLDILMEQPVREIKFVDRCFNIDDQRARSIMEYTVNQCRNDQSSNNQFHFEIIADRLSDSLLDFLATVPPGRFNFEIGVQSIHPDVLAAVGRSCDLPRLQSNIDRLIAAGNIHIHLDLLAGLPGEDLERFAASFDWIFARHPHYIQLGFLKMLKGTAIRAGAASHGYIYKDYPPYEVMANNYLSHDDIIVLKNIETVVDRLYNSQIMPGMLSYIIETVYGSRAFEFFRDMAVYWQQAGRLQQGQKREEYYTLALGFISAYHPEHAVTANEWARYDYLCHHCSLQLPPGVASINPAPRNQAMLEQWKTDPELLETVYAMGFNSVREARNHLHVQYFMMDPRTGRTLARPQPVIFAYERHSRAYISCVYPGTE